MQPLDVADPDPGPPMRELGEVLQGWRGEPQQMLALQVAVGALAGDGRDLLRLVLRQRRLRPGSKSRAWTASKRPATIRTRSRYRNSVPGIPIASGGVARLGRWVLTSVCHSPSCASRLGSSRKRRCLKNDPFT